MPLDKLRGFAAKNGNVSLNDCPNQGVINGWILVGQLVAEVNDAPRPRNCLKNCRRDPSERCYGFADENELPLDGGPNQTIFLVALKCEVFSGILNCVARFNDVGQIGS